MRHYRVCLTVLALGALALPFALSCYSQTKEGDSCAPNDDVCNANLVCVHDANECSRWRCCDNDIFQRSTKCAGAVATPETACMANGGDGAAGASSGDLCKAAMCGAPPAATNASCPDGKGLSGPFCVHDAATNACAWQLRSCASGAGGG